MMLLVGVCTGMASLALLGGAVWAFYHQRNKSMSGVTTTGTVIDLTRELMDPGSPGVYCPIVEFTLPSDEKVIFTSSYGTRPASHKVGQNVNVRYDPQEPQKADIDSALTWWLFPGILAFMGLLACCLSLIFIPMFWLIPNIQ